MPPTGLILLSVLLAGLVWGSWNLTLDAWWQPTDHATITRMLELLDLEEGELVYDLGCGDGRFLTRAVEDFDLRAVGIEIDPLRVLASRLRILVQGTAPRASVVSGDMYQKDLSEANGVVLFLSEEANEKLAPKFERELGPGTRVVSYYHELPGLGLVHEEKNEKGYPIYLYEVEADE